MISTIDHSFAQRSDNVTAGLHKVLKLPHVVSTLLTAWKGRMALWCALFFSLCASTQAFASDNFNFCESHETPPEVLVSLPEDDAPKSLSDEFIVDAYFFNGNFQTLDGHRYSYELTYLFFEGTTLAAVGSITDIDRQEFHHKIWASFGVPYRETVDGYDLTIPDGPLSTNPPRVIGSNGNALFKMEIDGITVELALSSLKNPAYFFHNGFGAYIDPATGEDVGSNFYYGRTRNLTLGKIKQDAQTQLVIGESWAERQYTLAFQGDVVWTWYAIRLDNGEEIMAYDITMRQTGDQVILSGTFVGAPGACDYEELAPEDVIMTSSGAYTSPHTGNVYPTDFALEVPSKGLELTLTPVMQDQEGFDLLGLLPAFWSGGATVQGIRDGEPVQGHAEIQLWVGPVSLGQD